MPTIDISGTHEIQLSAPQTMNKKAAKLHGRPTRIGFGFSMGILLIKKPNWLLDAHFGLAMGLYRFAFRKFTWAGFILTSQEAQSIQITMEKTTHQNLNSTAANGLVSHWVNIWTWSGIFSCAKTEPSAGCCDSISMK